MRAALAIAAALLAGCASTSDIDMRQVESACGTSCTKTYSGCLNGGFTLFPIQQQHQCTSALKLCVQACPARKPSD